MKLYKINAGLRALIEGATERVVDEETGEVFSVDNLENLELARDEKIEGCAVIYKELLAEADALKSEMAALKARKEVVDAKALRLKEYIADNLTDGERLKTAKVAIGWRKSEKAIVSNAEAVPDALWRIKREPMLDVAKAALKRGEEVPGFSLVVSQNLQIK